MFVPPLSADEKPSILFRAECSSNRSFRRGYLRAQRTPDSRPPSAQDFDDHLSWQREESRFLSFGTWKRAVSHLRKLEREKKTDVVVIAVWVKGLAGVYSAEEAACRLKYSDTDTDRKRKPWPHRDEYLLDGGIAADDYRVLAVFEGGGPEHDVVFECPLYQITTRVPSGLFLGQRSNNTLGDIEYEIYSRSGVHDDMKRDELVKAITGNPHFPPILQYEYLDQSENIPCHRTTPSPIKDANMAKAGGALTD